MTVGAPVYKGLHSCWDENYMYVCLQFTGGSVKQSWCAATPFYSYPLFILTPFSLSLPPRHHIGALPYLYGASVSSGLLELLTQLELDLGGLEGSDGLKSVGAIFQQNLHCGRGSIAHLPHHHSHTCNTHTNLLDANENDKMRHSRNSRVAWLRHNHHSSFAMNL
ncbi:hypothetical protein E2C01_034133 [Portunus trituberculatus]|uniref:Uncharacterized protein n=1 Tax=Portunus trituberculatus TaxID=210409 RepID=A0A5B7F0N5_PORTR|nr:hypothetical protein [Portunus trituberculatus]